MHEFGSLNAAYGAIGYAPNLDPARSDNRAIERCTEKRVADITIEVLRARGHEVRYKKHTDTLCVDGRLRLKLVVRSPWLVGGQGALLGGTVARLLRYRLPDIRTH